VNTGGGEPARKTAIGSRRRLPPKAPRYIQGSSPSARKATLGLAFTRYSFTSRLLCTNQLSFHAPRSAALPTLVQYYCTMIGRYKTPLPTSRLYTIHHTILAITISCKGQLSGPLSVRVCSSALCRNRSHTRQHTRS